MPRASASGKRTSGAGQRDTRHENGLVGPATAKRLHGKKSQAQLEGGPARSVADLGPGQAGLSSSAPSSSSAAAAAAGHSVAKHVNHIVSNVDLAANRRASICDESESESGGSNMGNHVDGGHRQIDVNAMKDLNVHRDPGPFELATTVLKSLPMQDTLAILIILMHVPSVALTFIYAAFTLLTFVPPVTTSSGMNIDFAGIFDGNSNTPSLFTVIGMDVFFLLFWLFLWQPLQDIILDFAKPVIAITLGGGNGARTGASRGLTTCFMWILCHHLLRGTKSHLSKIASHIPDGWSIPATVQESFSFSAESIDTRGSLGWIRSILAVHILTQGVVRYVKEWYLRREKVSAQSGINDPEAGKAQSTTTEATSTDAGFSTPDTEAGAHQPPPPPAMSKKRRKQSTQIRLQQPLWAALASTKIVVMKEYELSHSTSERGASNATDVHNLGNAPFEKQPGQVWISYVGSDEVCFNTSHFCDAEEDSDHGTNGNAIPTSAKHPEKPFYVRVNNAFWQPTRMFPVEEGGEDSEVKSVGTRWTGDIYGLRPASKYVCEFVNRQTDDVIFKTSIRTIQEPQREAEAGSAAVANGQRSLRPDSPATTLKTSIEAAETRLAEEKNKLKTSRKEWKTRFNTLRKEIEATDHQLQTAGNNDEKFRQKIRQQETQKAQAERDTEALTEQSRSFDTAPELADQRKKLDRQFTSEKAVYDAAKKDFEDFKGKLEKVVKAKDLERSNLISKVNKIRTRINKVETELANITDANNRGLNEEQRRRQERASWEEGTAAIDANYRDRLAHARAANAAKVEQIRVLEAQLTAVVAGVPPEQFQPAVPLDIQPGMWNPHHPWAATTADFMPSVATIVDFMPPVGAGLSNWNTALPPRRGRSSSMLSDVSGFTQSSEEGLPSSEHVWRNFGQWRSPGGSGPGSPVG